MVLSLVVGKVEKLEKTKAVKLVDLLVGQWVEPWVGKKAELLV